MTFVGQHASFKGRNLRTMPTVPDGENVTYIDLSDNPISSFNQFITYPNLRFLCIDNTKIVSFHYAPELPMLEEFTCRGTSLSCSQYLQLMTVIVFGDRMKFVNGVKVDQRTWMLGKAARAEYRKHLIEGFVFLKIDPIKMINNETRQRKSIFNDLSKLISKESIQPMTRSISTNAIPSNRTNPKNLTQQEKIDQQRPKIKVGRTVSNNDDVLVSYANAKQNVANTEKKLKSQFSLMSNRILASAVDQRSMATQQNAIIEAHTHHRKHHANGKSISDNTAQKIKQDQDNNNNSTKRKKRSSTNKQEDNYDDKFKNIQKPTKHNSSFDLTTLSKNDNQPRLPKGTKPPLPPTNQNRKQNRKSLNPMIHPPSTSLASSSSTSSSSSSSTDENQQQQQQQQPSQGHRKRSSKYQSDQTKSIQSNRHSESMPNLAEYHRQHRHHKEQEEVVQDEEEAENFEFEPRPGFEHERSKHSHQPPPPPPPPPQFQPHQNDDEQNFNQQEDEAHLATPKRRVKRSSSRQENDAQNEAELDDHQQNHHIRRRASQQPQTEKMNETEVRKQRSSDQLIARPPIPVPRHHSHQIQARDQAQFQAAQDQEQHASDRTILQVEQRAEAVPVPHAGGESAEAEFAEEEEEDETAAQNEQPQQQPAELNAELEQQPHTEASADIVVSSPEASSAREDDEGATIENRLENQFTSQQHQAEHHQQQSQVEATPGLDARVGSIGDEKIDDNENSKQQPKSEPEIVGQSPQNQAELLDESKGDEDEDEDDEETGSSKAASAQPSSSSPSQAPPQQPSVSFVSPPQPDSSRRTVRINIPHDLSAISENSPIFLSVNEYSSDGEDGLGGLLSEDSCTPPSKNNDNPSNIVLELLPEDLSSDDTSRRRRNNAVASFPTNSD